MSDLKALVAERLEKQKEFRRAEWQRQNAEFIKTVLGLQMLSALLLGGARPVDGGGFAVYVVERKGYYFVESQAGFRIGDRVPEGWVK